MKKIILPLIVLAFFAAQGCSLKNGVSYYGNDLTYRGWINETSGVEAAVNLSYGFDDNESTDGYGAAHSDTISGWDKCGFDLGVGYLHKLLKFDWGAVIAGVKYKEYMNYYREYEETKYYNSSGILYDVDYYESERVNFFNHRSVSITFPEAEIAIPYVPGLNLILSMDLLVFDWSNEGGYYFQEYSSSQDLISYYYYLDNGLLNPGRTDGFKVYTVAQGPARMKLGVVYYFQ